MSTAAVNTPVPEPAHSYLVKRTIEACNVAKDAAGAAAEGIATGSSPLLNTIRDREKELDTLDREIDDGVTLAITQVNGTEARELLACMKFMISLERIGDLLLSFASSAQSVGPRIDPQDTRDLTHMATVLEKMLSDAGGAFAARDVKKAVEVLRADAEMDRLRNLIFLRHIEGAGRNNGRRSCREHLLHHTGSAHRTQEIGIADGLNDRRVQAGALRNQAVHALVGPLYAFIRPDRDDSILHAVQQGFKLALAVSQGREVVFHVARRLVEGGRDVPNFIPRTFGDARGKLAAGDFVGKVHDPLQPARRELG